MSLLRLLVLTAASSSSAQGGYTGQGKNLAVIAVLCCQLRLIVPLHTPGPGQRAYDCGKAAAMC
jgi:hypothetical protein